MTKFSTTVQMITRKRTGMADFDPNFFKSSVLTLIYYYDYSEVEQFIFTISILWETVSTQLTIENRVFFSLMKKIHFFTHISIGSSSVAQMSLL